MKRITVPQIRLDPKTVDAPTINRALDNIVTKVNDLANTTANAITLLEGAPSAAVQDIQAGSGIGVVEAPPGTFTITNTDPGSAVDVLGGSGILVTESPAGTFTLFNTAQGGGGGGGVIYYLNEAIAGDAPVPVVGTKEFGTVIQPAGSTTGPIAITNTAYTTINTFITDLNLPNVTVIPAGLWDFNIWMECDTANPGRVFAEIRLFTWDGTTTTAIGSSVPTFITNHNNIAQYPFSVVVPQTAIAATDRIYAVLEARTTNGNHTITAYYGDGEPSHVHSTIPFPFVENILPGTAISVVEAPTGTFTVNNTAPDQIVVLTASTGISTSGTYPNFTITNTDPASAIDVTAGTAISVVESPTGTFAVTNTAPDQIVAMASGTGISVTGTYPSFTITNSSPGSSLLSSNNAWTGTNTFTNAALPLKATNTTVLNSGVLSTYAFQASNAGGYGVALGGTTGTARLEVHATGFSGNLFVNLQGGGDVYLPNVNSQLIVGSTTSPSATAKVAVNAGLSTTNAFYANIGSLRLDNGDATVIGTITGNTVSATTYTGLPVSSILAGTGINVGNVAGAVTVTNSLPDQTVVLTNGTGISVTGTYPNFTITNSDPGGSVDVVAGTGINVVESPAGTFTVTNDGALLTANTFTGTQTINADAVINSANKLTVSTIDSVTAMVIKPQTSAGTRTVTISGADSTGVAGSAVTIQAGTTTAPATTGGAVTIKGGGAVSQGGDVIIDGGAATTTQGAVSIGSTSSTRAVGIGRAGISSTVSGTLVANTQAPSGNATNQPTANGAGLGYSNTVKGGQGSTIGGDITVQGGQGGTGQGGIATVAGGNSTSGLGGATLIYGGSSGTSTGGLINIIAGQGATSGGALSLTGGSGTTIGGTATFQGGTTTGGSAGSALIFGGDTTNVSTTAGSVVTRGGNAIGATSTGGSVFIDAGSGTAINGRIAIGQVNTGGIPTSIRIGNNTNTNTEINGTAYTANQYVYAEGATANVNITNTTTPATLVYNVSTQSGISLNNATGDFTVPVTGIYRVNFNGILRAVTVPATTYWIAFELYDATTPVVVYTTSCFQPRATAGQSTAWATTDCYEFHFDTYFTLTAGRTYRIRARNNTAGGTFVAGFEPTLTNANTSRAGRRFTLNIERKT